MAHLVDKDSFSFIEGVKKGQIKTFKWTHSLAVNIPANTESHINISENITIDLANALGAGYIPIGVIECATSIPDPALIVNQYISQSGSQWIFNCYIYLPARSTAVSDTRFIDITFLCVKDV